MAGLNQLNVKYIPIEDRILLRMTADEPGGRAEYRLWLTRRFVALLWQSLEQLVNSETVADPSVPHGGREAMKKFRQEAALADANFSSPYSGGQDTSTPLGEEPLLVSKLQIKKQPRGLHSLSLQGDENVGITLSLNTAITFSLQKILADAVLAAQWALPIHPPVQKGSDPVSDSSREPIN